MTDFNNKTGKLDVRFVVKCTRDFKAAYIALCEARGTSASEEIRAFVAGELEKASKMNNKTRQEVPSNVSNSSKSSLKCPDTSDIFNDC